MSNSTAALPNGRMTSEERKVLAGTLVGTTIEWYDFFIYAQAAGLVLATLYFGPVMEGPLGQVVSFATIGISFLFRPLGAVVAGHLGDKLGRKKMLVFTLLMMGASTALIGLVPTYAQIGIAAPILLVVLRILQGFSAGGEWGGAALLSVEHAPVNKRGLFGAYPQIGVPIGMILATFVMYVLSTALTEEQFLSWGWRIPFLFSVVLIGVGYFIRRSVSESPVFKEIQERKNESSAPLAQLFKHNTREVILSALIFIANNAAGYLVIAFFASYATTKVDAGGLGMHRPSVLLATTLGSFGWLIFTLYGGILSDRIGRIKTFQIGYAWVFLWSVPMFLLIDTANVVLFAVSIFVLTIGLGLSYGPQSALYAEMFPARVRYSGVSIGYALGAILGGAFAPTIAQMLLNKTGWSPSIGIYIMVLCVISFAAVTMVKETKGADLHIEEAGQKNRR
ncbi:MHS family MFS transporter [Arthrobacter jiangjiafuii]|uniref:Putative proline/betaine transporter n=1 Tax=Arthrobacter jiangjiafuii TaxID=2817475 RepID=A0A975M4Q8_9MICC|nr:MFS transporter [Arthrobacter jiangjiafuii]MBP3042301.1 MHS family MFS transporter [Arthrobacter jiangjiafuii]QWC09943.1 MHS family MFS transporter [Arthrobacter jiangjiafuii]